MAVSLARIGLQAMHGSIRGSGFKRLLLLRFANDGRYRESRVDPCRRRCPMISILFKYFNIQAGRTKCFWRTNRIPRIILRLALYVEVLSS